MTRVAVLGSTGSIGTQTLDVVAALGPEFRIVTLAAGRNVGLLAEQIEAVRPALVSVADPADRAALRERYPGLAVEAGSDGLIAAATHEVVDVVVTAVTGALGLPAAVAALRAGKRLAPANKEPLVIAGELLTSLSRAAGLPLVPIDSEHSAVYQCLAGAPVEQVARILLTASGGPFRGRSRESMQAVTVADALAHPTWKMGRKITVDSATMMNKGLEVIEAQWLFGLPLEKIEVVVHPQSIVHSLVEYIDGSVLAQMDYPDMRTPIQYALTYPQRRPSSRRRLSLTEVGQLTFEAPDAEVFACLRLAYQAARSGGTMPAVLNAANEVAVDRFLAGEVGFLGIAELVERVMTEHTPAPEPNLDELLAADAWARRRAAEVAA